MATLYDWSFDLFDTKPNFDGLTDVVSVIHWRLTATDGTIVVSNYGTVTLGDPSPAEFTPYEDITKDMTIQWMEASTDVSALKSSLDSQIETAKNPPTVPTIPPFDQTN